MIWPQNTDIRVEELCKEKEATEKKQWEQEHKHSCLYNSFIKIKEKKLQQNP